MKLLAALTLFLMQIAPPPPAPPGGEPAPRQPARGVAEARIRSNELGITIRQNDDPEFLPDRGPIIVYADGFFVDSDTRNIEARWNVTVVVRNGEGDAVVRFQGDSMSIAPPSD
jgi:hypothetical protein